MKHFKICGLAALLAALMTFTVAGTASATTLKGSGESELGAGTAIKAESEINTILHPVIGDIICERSTFEGEVTNGGGSNATVSGSLSEQLLNGDPKGLTFSGCNAEVTVLRAGSLEIHTRTTSADNNGTVTSSNAQVTVTFSGFHCIFTTSSTDIGTLTGSSNTKATATLDIEATIPRTGGRSGAFCGSTAQWTGFYKITTPDFVNVI